jgi:pSer/pThr/pTyr-binding forkhead associated (FHA) protein
LTKPSPRLVWCKSDGSEVEFKLSRPEMVVGRDEAVDIRVDEPLVSRCHARIHRLEEGFAVTDLDSTNLTRVNDEVIRHKLLSHGDELRFARARCLYYEGPVEKAEQS